MSALEEIDEMEKAFKVETGDRKQALRDEMETRVLEKGPFRQGKWKAIITKPGTSKKINHKKLDAVRDGLPKLKKKLEGTIEAIRSGNLKPSDVMWTLEGYVRELDGMGFQMIEARWEETTSGKLRVTFK
jgi:hypothetical protein